MADDKPLPRPGMKWRPIKLETQLAFTGGFQCKSFVLESMEVNVRGSNQVFVRIDKGADWLVKSSAGPAAQRGALKRSNVIAELKAKLVEVEMAAAVAETELDEEEEDVDDPMNLLDSKPEGLGMQPKRKAKRRYLPKRQSGRIEIIEMPKLAPSAHPLSTLKQKVKVIARGTNCTWIAMEDVAWLVHYLADEVAFGAVVCPNEPPAVAEPNSTVPGLRIHWDFQSGNSWHGIFLEGPLKGKQFSSSVEQLTLEKWKVVADMNHIKGTLAKATYEVRKSVTLHFLEAHCQQLLTQLP
jgi:hypothetical protein